ncbi:unnamed protein product, partial [Ectocarpus sp. 8 AP-2014]
VRLWVYLEWVVFLCVYFFLRKKQPTTDIDKCGQPTVTPDSSGASRTASITAVAFGHQDWGWGDSNAKEPGQTEEERTKRGSAVWVLRECVVTLFLTVGGAPGGYA